MNCLGIAETLSKLISMQLLGEVQPTSPDLPLNFMGCLDVEGHQEPRIAYLP